MTTQPTPAPQRSRRILGMTGETAGIVGIVLCVLGIVAVLYGVTWVHDRTDEVVTRIDAALAKGEPLLDAAGTRVNDITDRVGMVADVAAGLAANPNPAPGISEALADRVSRVSERYLDLRATYTDFRETAISALDRLETLGRVIPGLEFPQGPVDALAAVDARIRELDAAITGLVEDAPLAGPINAVAGRIAERAGEIQATLEGVGERIERAQEGLVNVRTEVLEKGDQVKLLTTLLGIILVLVLVYSIFLHWVLFSWSRDHVRSVAAAAVAGTPSAPATPTGGGGPGAARGAGDVSPGDLQDPGARGPAA